MYRALRRCGALALCAAICVVAALIFDTVFPHGRWALQDLLHDPPSAASFRGLPSLDPRPQGGGASSSDAAGADTVGATPSADPFVRELPAAAAAAATTTAAAGGPVPGYTARDLRAELLPHDQLIAEDGDDASMVLVIVLTLNSMDQSYNYSSPKAAWWAKKVFDINRNHSRRYSHPVVLRQAPIVHTAEKLETCRDERDKKKCMHEINRQASTWEKFVMMRDVLRLPGVVYVFCLDADAVFAHTEQDTMRRFARLLEASPGKDLVIAKEDWRHKGRNSINTGVMLARSTDFTRALYRDLVSAFLGGSTYAGPGDRCQSNEQKCLQRWMAGRRYPNISDRILVVSSLGHNFSPCAWYWCPNMFPTVDKKHACHACWLEESCRHECDLRLNDSRIEVIHFLGDSKFYLEFVMPLLPQL